LTHDNRKQILGDIQSKRWPRHDSDYYVDDREQSRHHAGRPMNLPNRAKSYPKQIGERTEVRTRKQWD
jgi:hypothetical protein